jgi:hypothetical protein
MIGTLLLCLPSLFHGGDLAVEMGKEKQKFFGRSGTRTLGSGHSSWWLDYSNMKANHKKIPWCAFFADTNHEIHEVTAGVRVTLAYQLRRKDGASASPLIPRTLGDNEQTAALVMALREMVADNQFLADGGKIGFPCEHLYTNGQVYPQKRSADDPLSAKATQNLKGRDRLVAQAASQASLEIYLKPFVTHDYARDDEGDYFLDKFPNKKRVPKRMSDDTISSFFGSSERQQASEMADIWAIDVDAGASQGFGGCEWNSEGYFGNEASSIDLYVQAVLLIEVPAKYERGELETKKAKAN